MARSSNSAELQAAADAEGELSYIRLSLRELVGETIPLQQWQEAAAQIPSVLVLDSRGVYDALARSESACLGLKDKRSGLEGFVVKTLLGGNTLWTSMDTFGCTTSRLHDQGDCRAWVLRRSCRTGRAPRTISGHRCRQKSATCAGACLCPAWYARGPGGHGRTAVQSLFPR